MNCPFCHARVEADDLFCMKCEQELPTTTGATPDTPPVAGLQSTTDTTKVTTAAELNTASSSTARGVTQGEVSDEPLGEGWVHVPLEKPRLLTAEVAQFPVGSCPNCGALADQFEADGMCGKCFAQALRSKRDDFYIKVSNQVAARSHQGKNKSHPNNEDFVDVGSVVIGDKTISWVVVCDGVSQCTNPQAASSAACAAAGAVLRRAALDDDHASEALLREALVAAQKAVCAVPPMPGAKPEYGPPACTITAVFVKDGEAFYGWCGDSRIYVIDRVDSGLKVRLLTRDHTYLNWILDTIEDRRDDCALAAAAAGIADNDVARAEKYLGLKYQAALLDGNGAALEELELDVEVVDGMNGLVKIKTGSLHSMVQSLGAIAEGYQVMPSFGRIKLDKTACIFACTDGVWNDVHPMDVAEAPMFAEMFTECRGSALEFACITVNYASGVDNDTCGVILL